MSAIGTKRTSLVALHMSAFGGKADIASRRREAVFLFASCPAGRCNTLSEVRRKPAGAVAITIRHTPTKIEISPDNLPTPRLGRRPTRHDTRGGASIALRTAYHRPVPDK